MSNLEKMMHWTFLTVGLTFIIIPAATIGACVAALSQHYKYLTVMTPFFNLYPKNFDGVTCYETAVAIATNSDNAMKRMQSVLSVESKGDAQAFIASTRQESDAMKKIDQDLKKFYFHNRRLGDMFIKLKIGLVTFLVVSAVEICAAGALMHGVNSHNMKLVKPWLVLNYVILFLMGVSMALSFAHHFLELGLIIALILIPCRVVSILVLKHGFKQMTESEFSIA